MSTTSRYHRATWGTAVRVDEHLTRIRLKNSRGHLMVNTYVWIEDDRALAAPTGTMARDAANGVSAGPMTEGWSLEAVLPELTRRCVGFIRDRAQADEPFLLYFSMTSPHTPISPSEAFQGQSGVSDYADFLLETDWSVGQVLRALDQQGIADPRTWSDLCHVMFNAKEFIYIN